uniref:Tc1-like transposase DDE domain-containing protein n=1 Tax=Cyprinus carpio carpio TaxID=630221 RepID=A0A9J8CM16_CYPCA
MSFGNQGARVWRKTGEKEMPKCLKSSVKYPQSVMVWGAMSAAGVGPLCFIKGRVNAASYQEILEHFMLPSAEKLYGDEDFVFQHDLAPAHSAKTTGKVQCCFSVAQVRRFCHCFWFKSTRLCTVALDVSTPDSVHCFRRSPKVWNRSFSTIFLRVRSPLLVVQGFLPHFFLPTDFPLRCLDTALWEQPIRSEISFCVLPSRLRVSMMAFWTAVRSAVLPMIAVLSNEPGWEFLKASGIFCRCLS